MKSINEAIKHAMEVAEEKRNYFAPSGEFMGDNPDCVKCAEEHEQLAEWLEELKKARKGFEENRKAGYEHGYADGYKQAVDEFVEAFKKSNITSKVFERIFHMIQFAENDFHGVTIDIDNMYCELADEIAEQMKGVRNE